MLPINDTDINNRFGFHPATEQTKNLHTQVRWTFLDVAKSLNEILPEGREKSLCFTALQEAAMWANAAIACNLAPLDMTEVNDFNAVDGSDNA